MSFVRDRELGSGIVGYSGSTDFLTEVSKGNVPGHYLRGQVVRKDLCQQVFEDFWSESGDLNYPITSETWEIVSDSPNDSLTGTGARTVVVNYLDINYEKKVAVVNLNGTTPVTINTDHYRPDGAVVINSGSGHMNEGTIKVRAVGGGDTRQVIVPGVSASQDCHITIPAGQTAFFLQTQGFYPKNESGNQTSEFMFFGSNTWVNGIDIPTYQDGYDITINARVPVPERTDLKFQVRSDNANVYSTAIIELLFVENQYL